MAKIFSSILDFFVGLIKGILGFILILLIVTLVVFFIIGGWLVKKYDSIYKQYDVCIDKPVTTDLQKYIKNQKFDIDLKTRYVTVNVDNKVFLSPILDSVQKIELPDKITKPFNTAGKILYNSIGLVLGAKQKPAYVCLKVIDSNHVNIFLGKTWYLWGSMQLATRTEPSGMQIDKLKVYTFEVPEKYVREYMADEATFLFDVGNIPISSLKFDKQGVSIKYYVSDLPK